MRTPDTASLRVVVYYRVGLPTLNLEKQRLAVECYGWFRRIEELREYTEIETHRLQNRPQLDLALSEAERLGADLLIADIGLLTLDVPFLTALHQAQETRGVKSLARGLLDGDYLPTAFLLDWAKWEVQAQSERTKQGLAAAKARGSKIGTTGAAHIDVARAARSAIAATRRSKYLSIITKIRRAEPGIKTLQGMADALTARGVKTPAGQSKWSASQIRRVTGPARKKASSSDQTVLATEPALQGSDGNGWVLH